MDDKPKRSRLFWVIITLLGLPVLYPLSMGPMYFMMEHIRFSDATQRRVQCFYYPVVSLLPRVPVLERVLVVYCHAWQAAGRMCKP